MKAKKRKVIQGKEARMAREPKSVKKTLEAMSKTLRTFMSHMDTHFGTIAEAMAREQEMVEKNAARVVEELLTLEALTGGEVIKAADILAAEPSKSAVFFSLPPHLKRQYVLSLLDSGIEQTSKVEIDKNNVDSQNADADGDAECHDPSTSSSQIPITYEYPESDFHSFEEGKSIDKFQQGQIWALYSDIDKYPKYYGWIRKVELGDFRVHVIWLEACPSREKERPWLGEDLPIGCGTFKIASGSIIFDTTDTFSHLVKARPAGRKNQFVILPSIGEIWAVYKNWRAGWTCSDFENCEYDVVEICEHTDSGMRVSLLTKVTGYRAVFRPERKGNTITMMEILEDEFLRFSHQIPAFRLTGERGGKLRGYWELDTASVPEIFLSSNVD